jgi:superfamily II RNA helicase
VDGKRPQTNKVTLQSFMKLLQFHKQIDQFTTKSFQEASPITQYDDFQNNAKYHISKDHSILVSAPTGSGMIIFFLILFF